MRFFELRFPTYKICKIIITIVAVLSDLSFKEGKMTDSKQHPFKIFIWVINKVDKVVKKSWILIIKFNSLACYQY